MALLGKKSAPCNHSPHMLPFLPKHAHDSAITVHRSLLWDIYPLHADTALSYNLMGFSWLKVKVEKGRMKRCRWLIWRCGRKKEDRKRKWQLLQLARDAYLHDSFPTTLSRFRTSWVNRCYFHVIFHSNSFGICLSLSPNGPFTFSTCCYHLFLNSFAWNFIPTSLLHFILY